LGLVRGRGVKVKMDEEKFRAWLNKNQTPEGKELFDEAYWRMMEEEGGEENMYNLLFVDWLNYNMDIDEVCRRGIEAGGIEFLFGYRRDEIQKEIEQRVEEYFSPLWCE
jgi:hypothetical protein